MVTLACRNCKMLYRPYDDTNINWDIWHKMVHCPICGGKMNYEDSINNFSNYTGDHALTLDIFTNYHPRRANYNKKKEKDANSIMKTNYRRIKESVDNEVKNLSNYGSGWAFKSGENIDLSKFTFNKGWKLYIAHFGYVDPLIGDVEITKNNQWYANIDSAKYVLDKLGVANDWLNRFNNFYDITDGINTPVDFDTALQFAVEHSPYDMIAMSSVVSSKLMAGDDNAACIFGIEDKDYFLSLVAGYIVNSGEYRTDGVDDIDELMSIDNSTKTLYLD